MKTVRADRLALLAGAALLWTAASAQGEVSARLTIASGYLHRGLDHSVESPAYQAALEYQRGGWFAGIWGSTVDFGAYDGRSAETDYYVGYGRRLNPSLAVEATVVHYTFHGASPRDDDWTELQLSAYLAERWTVTWGIADHWWASEEPSRFVEATYRHPLPWRLALDATAGYQLAERAADVDYGYAEAGIARRFGSFVVRAGYSAVESAARERFHRLAENRWTASLTWQIR